MCPIIIMIALSPGRLENERSLPAPLSVPASVCLSLSSAVRHDQLFDLLIVITQTTGCSSHNIPDFADFLARFGSLLSAICTRHPPLGRLCCFDLGSAFALPGSLVYHVAATSAPQNNNNSSRGRGSNRGSSSNGVFGLFGAALLCSQRTDISLAQLDACPSLHLSISPSSLWIISLI